MRLTDTEVRDVLARAEQIEQAARVGSGWNAELAAVIGAAEEVGLSRQAVERAIQERLNVLASPPAPGSQVWARSSDGKYYAATVLSTSDSGARVRFLRGSEGDIPADGLRPCEFLPGDRVGCHWPWWGPWTCNVVSYDATRGRVLLDDGWGYRRTFKVAEVWYVPPKHPAGSTRFRVHITLLTVGAVLGGGAGALVTWLLLR